MRHRVAGYTLTTVGELYRIEFPDLFRLWTSHDLVDPEPGYRRRPWFYEGLRREDETVAWKFIEEDYLRRYRSFVRIDFDWMADGLWEIPFPGSVGLDMSVSPEYFKMPEPLATRIHAWQANLDSREPGAEPEDEDFDYEVSDAEGLELAEAVKLFLGDDYYVEYWPFREIVIQDGEPIELGVPAFITDLTR